MGTKIHVFNLDHYVSSSDLEMVFSPYGVKEVYVVVDRETGMSRGYAFVEMESENEALKAISCLNGIVFKGRAMRVELVRSASKLDKKNNKIF